MEQGQEDLWNVTQADWDVHKALMYLQLKRAIEENRTLILKLEKLKRRLVMPQMAWLNRNLLELDIWVEYTTSSEDRAREFWEDSIRDAISLVTQGTSKKGKKPKDPKRLNRRSLPRKKIMTLSSSSCYKRQLGS